MDMNERVEEITSEFNKKYSRVDVKKMSKIVFSEESSRVQYEYVEQIFSVYGIEGLENKKVLEIGSGYGQFLTFSLAKKNINIFGVEPSSTVVPGGRYEIARDLLKSKSIDEARLVASCGETLPFADNSFDRVLCLSVLEHVVDPQKVIAEATRVLRPGGIALFDVPNYNFIYEGHYRIFWIPGMNKSIAKFYVRFLGRNPDYIDELNFITRKKIINYVKNLDGADLVGDLGMKFLRNRVRKADFNYSYPELAPALNFLRKIGVVELLVYFCSALKFNNTFQVIIQKSKLDKE